MSLHTHVSNYLVDHLTPNVRGALWLVTSGLFFSTVGAIVKWTGSDLHALQIVFFRCLFGLILLSPLLLRNRGAILRTQRQGIHNLRALVGIFAMTTTFYAYANLPLADVTALSFTNPLFMIPLAVLFLGEKVHWRRWSATAMGFIGVLVMLRPGTAPFNPDLLAAIISPFLIAGVRVLIKSMATTEATFTIVGRYSIASTLLSMPLALWVWRWPTVETLLLLALASAIATLASAMMVRAYAAGEATAITPFDYTRLFFASGYGMMIFGEPTSLFTWIGAAIILAATLYIAHRDRIEHLSRTPAVE
ncbi:DMT family transporter [Magnetococcus sp. PR-3]|uniref:DMT family transporter n=1 Tax=Magnetococcus sp. PR-3 TaxID=3120355 RepID=UPI002FCE0845